MRGVRALRSFLCTAQVATKLPHAVDRILTAPRYDRIEKGKRTFSHLQIARRAARTLLTSRRSILKYQAFNTRERDPQARRAIFFSFLFWSNKKARCALCTPRFFVATCIMPASVMV
jgi:hypothetical protein